ncbi:MAG: BatD family protein, partial [Bacteroidales bacterium]|nr:BatD family protein [Bacteroidales bacterium]
MMNHTSANTSRSLVVRLFASVLLCLMTTLQVSAQQFTAKVEDVGGYYRLTFTLTSSDASSFTPPSLAQFEVLSGPATSTYSSYQLVNGR